MALDKVIDSAELDANLTAVADAIRTKGGTTGELEFPGGFVSAVEGIQAGGGDDVAKSIVDRSISAYSDGAVTSVGSYAFAGCTGLESVNLPNVTSIGANAFASCSKLVSVSAPKLTTLGASAFSGASSLDSVDFFDSLSSIPNNAFVSTKIQEVISDSITSIGSNSFNPCTSLRTVNLSNVKTVGDGAFGNCPIVNIYMPNLETISTGSFGKSNFKTVVFPKVTRIGGTAFIANTSLELADFPVLTYFTDSFMNCSKFKTLILRASSVCTCSTINAFKGTPFASGGTGGTVYVPSALITQYQQATNWSTLYAAGTCNFVAIEGSEYE